MNWLKILGVEGSEADRRVARIAIQGVIGGYDWFDDSGVTATSFRRMVDALGELDAIEIDLNSPGGVVSDGVDITNYLIRHPAEVSITVTGQASSIASVILQAADLGKRHLATGATVFVHDPLTLAIGDADELRAVAARLDKVRDAILEVYARHGSISADDARELMEADTTMTSSEALEWGFADTADAQLQAVACEDLSEVLAQARQRTSTQEHSRQEPTDTVAALRSRAEQAEARLAEQAEAVGVEAIAEECKQWGLTDLLPQLIERNCTRPELQRQLGAARQMQDALAAAGVDLGDYMDVLTDPVAAFQRELANRLAAEDEQHRVDGNHGPQGRAVIDTRAIYDRMNQRATN